MSLFESINQFIQFNVNTGERVRIVSGANSHTSIFLRALMESSFNMCDTPSYFTPPHNLHFIIELHITNNVRVLAICIHLQVPSFSIMRRSLFATCAHIYKQSFRLRLPGRKKVMILHCTLYWGPLLALRSGAVLRSM